MEAVHEFETQRDEQRNAQHDERQERRHGCVCGFDIGIDAPGGIAESKRNDCQKSQDASKIDRMIELGFRTVDVLIGVQINVGCDRRHSLLSTRHSRTSTPRDRMLCLASAERRTRLNEV